MNVSLTPELEKWVQSKVQTGLYGTSSEVVREALRLLHQFEEERVKKLEDLRSELHTGLEQFRFGQLEELNSSTLHDIKQRGRNRLHGKKA